MRTDTLTVYIVDSDVVFDDQEYISSCHLLQVVGWCPLHIVNHLTWHIQLENTIQYRVAIKPNVAIKPKSMLNSEHYIITKQ